MLAVQPRGDDGGDEELRAVAIFIVSQRSIIFHTKAAVGRKNVRVRTSVGHGKKTRLGVLQVEVLIGELLTVDGTTTSALYQFN